MVKGKEEAEVSSTSFASDCSSRISCLLDPQPLSWKGGLWVRMKPHNPGGDGQ